MMRPWLLALCALALAAGPIEARTAKLGVIGPLTVKKSDASYGVSDVVAGTYIHQCVTKMLDGLGVDYAVIPPAYAKATWCSTGVFTMGSETITVEAVLHERFYRRGAGLDHASYRPDSLTLNGRLPGIPQLMLVDPSCTLIGVGNGFVDATGAYACSAGVADPTTSVGFVYGGSGVPHECEASVYQPGHDETYMNAVTVGGAVTLNPTRPSGGIIKLLSIMGSKIPKWIQESGIISGDPFGQDTLSDNWASVNAPRGYAGSDTCVVWKRPNGHKTGAAPLVFAFVADAGVTSEESYTATAATGFSPQSFMVALAALDSVMDGTLITKQLAVGVVVNGGFARATEVSPWGLSDVDSTVIKASIDSLAGIGVPFVVGVNIDSVASYPNEKVWWARAPRARYALQSWRGVRDSVETGTQTANQARLVDVFGHFRARQAYGPALGAAKDTSAYALFRYGFDRMELAFPGKTSRFGIPPLGDWVPKNQIIADSVLIAWRLAGGRGMLIDGRDSSTMFSVPRAWQLTNRQGYLHGVPLLAHAGYPVTGSTRLIGVLGHETSAGLYFVSDSGYIYHPICGLVARAASGLFGGSMGGRGSFGEFVFSAISDTCCIYDVNWARNSTLVNRACILNISAQDLGGASDNHGYALQQPTGAPLRPGWWYIKAMRNWATIVNRVAGRTLISFKYPDDIEP